MLAQKLPFFVSPFAPQGPYAKVVRRVGPAPLLVVVVTPLCLCRGTEAAVSGPSRRTVRSPASGKNPRPKRRSVARAPTWEGRRGEKSVGTWRGTNDVGRLVQPQCGGVERGRGVGFGGVINSILLRAVHSRRHAKDVDLDYCPIMGGGTASRPSPMCRLDLA